MNRRALLRASRSALLPLLPALPARLWAQTIFRRCRPGDAAWPPRAAWQKLNDAVAGNLHPVDFPISKFTAAAPDSAAKALASNIKNPYFVGDQPGLTQTLGWVDAWVSKPSVYAVAARHANDVATAVNFARQNALRLVIKGGGHSYQGTSNAPDSLLIWTRRMNGIALHDAFVPQGCARVSPPQHAVTLGAGAIWMQAYQAVTTRAGRYVQGGGCTTVGVAGLVQSGGFGSLSKGFGTAAGSLLEAEVVTADGQIRTANACTNADLFWALKGGGGGTFGVVTKVTLRTHALPAFFGVANLSIKAASDDAYRRLIREFVRFYQRHLFNAHWGEQAEFRGDNTLEIKMVAQGLDAAQIEAIWQPFLDWLGRDAAYSRQGITAIGAIPARHFWDVAWWKAHWPEIVFPRAGHPLNALLDAALVQFVPQPILAFDERAGAASDRAWWKGDGEQISQFLWGFESLWLPQSLLENGAQQGLADALFASSRLHGFALHFNKGLAGAPAAAIAAARDTATNPAVLSAFALVITAAGEGPAYPGATGHEPDVAAARKAAVRIRQCIDRLRTVAPEPGAYVSESNYFEPDWQRAYWGSNYPRLAEIKRRYDPDGLFFVHQGVGSEQWSADGFTRG